MALWLASAVVRVIVIIPSVFVPFVSRIGSSLNVGEAWPRFIVSGNDGENGKCV